MCQHWEQGLFLQLDRSNHEALVYRRSLIYSLADLQRLTMKGAQTPSLNSNPSIPPDSGRAIQHLIRVPLVLNP